MNNWLNNYRKNPKFFWGWLLMLLFLGLLGFWIPLLFKYAKEDSIKINDLIMGGELSTFSIVILIEGFVTGITLPKSKRMSMLFMAVVLIAFIASSGVYFFLVTGIKTITIKNLILYSSIFAITLSVILYQFKTIDLEEGADAFVDSRNATVEGEARTSPDDKNPLPF
jgi:hypothetical protein